MSQMRKIFKREKFDIIQYSTPNASLYASLAGKFARVPVRLYCQWGMAFVAFSGLKRFIFKSIEKLICGCSTYIEPDSKGNLEFAHKEKLYSKNKSSVIWNGSACGINLDKFDFTKKDTLRQSVFEECNIPEESFVYGFVGRITRDKGINELFSAFEKLAKNNPDAYLLVVGPEDNDPSVDIELYQRAKKHPRVIFTGYTKEVEKYLSAMDIYILPSYREGFGMGVVEAQAMGVPVAVTNIPGPTDAMKKDFTGVVFESRNEDALLSVMTEMRKDEKLLSQFGKNAVTYVYNNFNQKKLFELLLEDRKRLLKTD